VTELTLRLYIAGDSISSRRAQQNLRRLKTVIESDSWTIEIVDVLESPALAEEAAIIATPTLTWEDGERVRRIVGDLSDTRRVLEFLGIELKGKIA